MTIILTIILFVYAWHLSGRITKLEKDITSLRALQGTQPPPVQAGTAPVPAAEFRPMPASVAPATAMYTAADYQDMGPSTMDNFIAWLQRDFMMKLGAFLLLLAIGWFVSYAFAENWIGPMGRIALGLLLGAALILVGVWRIKSFPSQGGVFAVIGSTTIIMTLFAAREIYDFFTPASALFLMFATVVFVTFLAVQYKTETLAFAGLLLGSVAPLLTNSPSPDIIGLFTYLLVISVGTLWVVWMTGWTKLTPTSLVIVFLYSLPFLLDQIGNRELVMLFTFIFVSLFYGANMVSLVRRHSEGVKHMATHTFTALGTAVFLVVWIEAAVSQEWKSLLYSFWAIVFVLGTYVVYNFTANRSAFYLYGAASLGLIGVATAAELEGPALTIAYILEIALITIAVVKVTKWFELLQRMLLLNAIPVLLSLQSLFASDWQYGIMHAHLVVLLLQAISLYAMGAYVAQQEVTTESDRDSKAQFTIVLLSLSGFYAASLIWLITHAVMLYDFATIVSLIIYTVVGVMFVVMSRTNNNQALKFAGGVLIGGVVLRLLFVEVWEMSLEGRIVTFLIIGALLISTAFISKLNSPRDTTAG